MLQALKDALNVIAHKALRQGAAAVTDKAHYNDPDEYNIILDAVKATVTDVEEANSRIGAVESANADARLDTLEGVVTTLQSNPPSATTGPKLLSSDPINGAIGVAAGKVITLVFKRFLLASTVNSTNIVLKDKNNSTVAATVSYDNQYGVTVTPSSNLSVGASPYALHITTGLKDLVGEAYSAEQVVGFSCGTDNYPSKPAISYDNLTYNAARINLVTPSTDDVGIAKYVLAYGSGTVIADPVTLPYTFPANLAANTDYTVKVGAVDTNGQTTWSDPVTFHTVANTAPVVAGFSLTAATSSLTVKATSVTDNEGDGIAEINVVWSSNSGDNPDTLFLGANKAVYTLTADINAFKGAGKAIAGTFTAGQVVYGWARAKDSVGNTGSWVNTTGTVPDPNTLISEGFEGTLSGANVSQNGTSVVAFSSTNPITGSKSLVIDKDAQANAASWHTTITTSENFIRVTVKLRIDRMPTAGLGIPDIAGIGKEWGLPIVDLANNAAGADSMAVGLSPDGYLIYYTSGATPAWGYHGTPLVVGTLYTIEFTYNRTTGATTTKLNGTAIANKTNTDNPTAKQFDTLTLGNPSTAAYTGKVTFDELVVKKV